MALFVAVHKWKPEQLPTIIKETLALFTVQRDGKLPKGVDLLFSYNNITPNGAFCIWVAPNPATLEQLFGKYCPVLKKGTEFVPVVQSYPPTMEYVVSIFQMMLAQAAPK
jgi:hypothetical protein